MPFNPVSPGVYDQEVNATTAIPAVATTVGAISGIFAWGPCFDPQLVTSQTQLQQVFGKPSNLNAETWFSAYNFLAYGDNLYTVRTTLTGASTNGTYNGVGSTNTIPHAATTAVGNAYANVAWAEALLVTNATYNSTTFKSFLETGSPSTSVANVNYAAKWPGALGNSLRVGVCYDANQYHSVVALSGTITGGASSGNSYNGVFTIAPGSNTGTLIFTASGGSNVAAGNLFANVLVGSFANGDYFRLPTGNRNGPYQLLQARGFANAVTNSTASGITIKFASAYNGGSTLSSNTVERWWEFYGVAKSSNATSWTSSWQFNSSLPTVKDLMLVVVVDQNGVFTNTPNTILEVYQNLSRATDAQNSDGSSNYYQTVINQKSAYVWAINDVYGFASNTANSLTASTPQSAPLNISFSMGGDGDGEANAPMSTLINGWSMFQGTENYKINLVIAGKSVGQSNNTAGITNTTYYNYDLPSWLISNLGNTVTGRGDCVVFFSPAKEIVVNNTNGNGIATDLVNWASLLPTTTRAVMDCNYKYQYDHFNGIYRWIPLNGDIAGLCVYTDTVSYPWMSPAGFNRGQIQNVVKLAWNPQQGDRDYFYPFGINPVVTFPGQGTYLYGDRTFTTQPSAFDRINVRRLFLYMEQAIRIAARYTLFELNDIFTQNQFKNLVTPFLKQIQATRGITDFQVITDASLNTPYVVDANQFLAAILVKPARSINFINITYYAVPDGVAFSTISTAV